VKQLVLKAEGLSIPAHLFTSVCILDVNKNVLSHGLADLNGYVTLDTHFTVFTDNPFEFYVNVDINKDTPPGSTFKFTVSDIKAVDIKSGVYAAGTVNALKLYGKLFTVAPPCSPIKIQKESSPQFLTNGIDVLLMKFSISNSCPGVFVPDVFVDNITFTISSPFNANTIKKVSSFELISEPFPGGFMKKLEESINGSLTNVSFNGGVTSSGITRVYSLYGKTSGLFTGETILVKLSGVLTITNDDVEKSTTFTYGKDFTISNSLSF
jgi:hypothetical protein